MDCSQRLAKSRAIEWHWNIAPTLRHVGTVSSSHLAVVLLPISSERRQAEEFKTPESQQQSDQRHSSYLCLHFRLLVGRGNLCCCICLRSGTTYVRFGQRTNHSDVSTHWLATLPWDECQTIRKETINRLVEGMMSCWRTRYADLSQASGPQQLSPPRHQVSNRMRRWDAKQPFSTVLRSDWPLLLYLENDNRCPHKNAAPKRGLKCAWWRPKKQLYKKRLREARQDAVIRRGALLQSNFFLLVPFTVLYLPLSKLRRCFCCWWPRPPIPNPKS